MKVTATALPSTLPAPAPTKLDVRFPEEMRAIENFNGDGYGQLRIGSRLIIASDPDDVVEAGQDFMAAVAAGAQLCATGAAVGGGQVTADNMLGVFHATSGAYYLSPMLWSSEGNGSGYREDLAPGDVITPLSTQLAAVVNASTWADLRVSKPQ